MRIVETKAYTYDELSDDAKEKAREWYRSIEGGSFISESISDASAQSLKELGWSLKTRTFRTCGGGQGSEPRPFFRGHDGRQGSGWAYFGSDGFDVRKFLEHCASEYEDLDRGYRLFRDSYPRARVQPDMKVGDKAAQIVGYDSLDFHASEGGYEIVEITTDPMNDSNIRIVRKAPLEDSTKESIKRWLPPRSTYEAVRDAVKAADDSGLEYDFSLSASGREHCGTGWPSASSEVDVWGDDEDEEKISEVRTALEEAAGFLEEWVKDLCHAIVKMADDEWEYQLSDEVVAENIRANEYEFTEDGERR